VCRIVRDDDGTVTSCAIAIGGVAPIPLRLNDVEDVLRGTMLGDDVITEASTLATAGATPLPETAYKVEFVGATVREVLERVGA
jgi:xanthine dehydrogenase YagS FAD-binding subunit